MATEEHTINVMQYSVCVARRLLMRSVNPIHWCYLGHYRSAASFGYQEILVTLYGGRKTLIHRCVHRMKNRFKLREQQTLFLKEYNFEERRVGCVK